MGRENIGQTSVTYISGFYCCNCKEGRQAADPTDRVPRMSLQGRYALYYVCSEACAGLLLERERTIGHQACEYDPQIGHPAT